MTDRHTFFSTEMVTQDMEENLEAEKSEIPDEVVREMQTERDNVDATELSLWDFAGQEVYYVTHQVSKTL